MSLPTKHTSPSEILHIIKKLHNNKALGHDFITNRIIKNLPKKSLVLLTFIYNSILQLSYIPLSWKHSIIILIHKPGKPENLPSSFRPFSLLPSFSKILERVILKRI
uniref:Putative RNA-directed DNA polymerase n=1 Tax=Sipha flava TaxID=143950 RepID=A0A2S2PXM8_9HEMI